MFVKCNNLKITLGILLLASPCLTMAQDNSTQDEPKAAFEVILNQKKFRVSADEELKLDSMPAKISLKIRQLPTKLFNNLSISFEYPGSMSYEFQQDYGLKFWTLSGNNLVLMVFELDTKSTLDQIVSESVKKFGKKNCTVEEIQRTLGGHTWKGQKITVTLAGTQLTQEYLDIPLNDFKTRFICMQDVIAENKHSEEYT